MKFRCERDILVEAFGTAGRGVAGRGSLPALTGLRLDLAGDRLQVVGSDRDLTIQSEVTVAGGADGVCVIPAKLATDIARALEPGAVEVEVGDDEARISSGRSQFAVKILPADEFPLLAVDAGEPHTIDAGVLADALRQVVRAASHDDNRPILTGVLLAAEAGGVRLVATDSYRLALRDLPGTSVLGEDQRVLIPSRALGELSRLLGEAGSVEAQLGERDATFTVGTTKLTTRLLEGEFPNYQQLIPASYPNRLTVGREPLLDAVRRVKLLARESTTPVRLTMRAEGLELSVISADTGQAHEELDAKYEGTELVAAFNPEYLIEGVDAVTSDEVIIESLDALKPATVRSTEGDDFLYLLMPVRVT